MAPLAERKNIELTTHVDPELPIANQDSGKLQQILYNLLSNAVKFTPDGGRVKVLALKQGSDQMDLVYRADQSKRCANKACAVG